jgi:nucleoside-diphosphate-sugar epimerase
MIHSVSILGCGWLGLPLGEYLLAEGFLVKGSTTHPEKVPLLAGAGIHPFLLSFAPHPAPGQLSELQELLNTDILIIAIPPQVEKRGVAFHPEQIRYLVQQLKASPVRKVIYVSSTSVYPEVNGEVDENALLTGHNLVSTAILQAEELVKGWGGDWVILRCGGLMGYNRIAGKYVAGRKGVTTGSVPVNFVHRDDVVGVIYTVIRQGIQNQVYNVVAPQHPTRREIYARNAHDFGYALPEYAESAVHNNKIVSSHKLLRETGYAFQYPNPLYFSYIP